MSIFQKLLNRRNSTGYSLLTTKEQLSMNDFFIASWENPTNS